MTSALGLRGIARRGLDRREHPDEPGDSGDHDRRRGAATGTHTLAETFDTTEFVAGHGAARCARSRVALAHAESHERRSRDGTSRRVMSFRAARQLSTVRDRETGARGFTPAFSVSAVLACRPIRLGPRARRSRLANAFRL